MLRPGDESRVTPVSPHCHAAVMAGAEDARMNLHDEPALDMTDLLPAHRSLRVAVVTETYPPEVNGVAMTMARLVDGLLEEARDHAERRALEDAQRAVVAELGRPTYELPRLAGGVDLGGLYELAADLKKQGLA